jgi:hypothetical protein
MDRTLVLVLAAVSSSPAREHLQDDAPTTGAITGTRAPRHAGVPSAPIYPVAQFVVVIQRVG